MLSSEYLSNKDFLVFLKSMNINLILDIDEEFKNQEKPQKISLAEINKENNKKKFSSNNEVLYFKISSKDYYNNNILKLLFYNL